MKLLTRTNLYYLFFSILTYLIVAISFYTVIEYLIYKEVDERLLVEKKDFEHYIEVNGYWLESCYFVEDKISVVPAEHEIAGLPAFKDTVLINRYNNSHVPFREYTFITQIGEDLSRVSIRKSLIESNQLLKVITVVMLVLLCICLALLYLFQRRISKTLWHPFYETLLKAKSFDVNLGQGLELGDQKIYEFNELNSSLAKMTDKIAKDYKNLKEFTENASHEIQTPLALINGRVEGLIQAKDISDEHMSWIQDIHESTMRLAKLNQALLLLSKIENGQFHEVKIVSINEIVQSKINALEEMFHLKNITLKINRRGDFVIEMHQVLADVLITNLITNAIKHNFNQDGEISIEIDYHRLVISNSGEVPNINPELLFERFKKQNNTSGSLGLGLAIVKKICVMYNLEIEYTFTDGLHILSVIKKSETAL